MQANRPMFINYAHRGASAYAPENTMQAFRLGVQLGANGIETDIRKTKDGVPVLFHDSDLNRLTGIDKSIADLTYGALKEIRIPAPDGGASDTVPTLSEFLLFAKALPVTLALELKDDNLQAEVLREIRRFGLGGRCFVTSFQLRQIGMVKMLDQTQRVGLLVRDVNEETINALKEIGAEQICPKAGILTPALVRSLRENGFNVRAWGVKDETLMQRALSCGVDGMTVDFPDKLQAYLNK